MEVTLRYGHQGLRVSLPEANVRHVLRFRPMPAVGDPAAATGAAVRQPIGCPPLQELARGRRSVCIVTADITRPVPNPLLLPVLLAELAQAGLPAEGVVILIGTGVHRPNTDDELRGMLGEEVLGSGARVTNHVAGDPDAHVYKGRTARGTPAYVDRLYAEADLRIALSLVEPHPIAGFSGGRKAICPGICGLETIGHFHGPELLDPDTACAGLLDGNPAHRESLEVTRLVGAPDLSVNVTLDEERRITGLFAGELEAAHLAAVAHSVAQSKVALPEPVDIALTTSAGHPLDLTFYQGVKGIIAPVPILRPGGTIIAAHECAEGIGEDDLVRRLLAIDSIDDYVPRPWDTSYFYLDQWVAQFSKAQRWAGEILSFSGGIPCDQLEQCFVTPISSVEEGVDRALRKHGPDASIAVLPEGPYVLPCLEGDRVDRQSFTLSRPAGGEP